MAIQGRSIEWSTVSSPAAPPPAKTGLGILFSVVVVDLIGFGIVMPILPFYAETFGADGKWLGLVFAAYAAAQFVCAPLWGRLSDRIGRRRVLLFTIAGTALALAALGFASSLAAVIAARTLAGAFAANVSVASAYISDVTPEEERTRWMGMLGASFGIGFVLGPAIGGLLLPWGTEVPLLFAAGLAALNAGAAALRLQEPTRHAASTPVADRRAALAQPLVRRLCLANFAFSAAVTQLETLFALFMLDRFGYDARDFAWLLVGMAVLMAGIQGGAMRRLAARYPERGMILVGSLGLALAFAALPFATSDLVLLAPLALAAASRAIVQPSMLALTSIAAAQEARGAVMGAFQSAASIARVVAPIAGGFLYDAWFGAPFLLAAALVLGVVGLARALPARAG
jgi:MFS family permease